MNPPLICPVKNCEWRIYHHAHAGESKREYRARMLSHLRTHWLRQFTMPVFLWRRDSKRWR